MSIQIDKENRYSTFRTSPQKLLGEDFYRVCLQIYAITSWTNRYRLRCQSYTPSNQGMVSYGTLTIRTKGLTARTLCSACPSEAADIQENLACDHGPVGRLCSKAIKAGRMECPSCYSPPSYTLAESNNSSSTDNLSDRLESWVIMKRSQAKQG